MNPEYLKLYHDGKLDISFFEFVILVLINQNEASILEKCHTEDFMSFRHMIANLEDKGYVKWYGTGFDEFMFRKKGEDLFGKLKKQDKSDIHAWIDQWRSIFPEGVNNGGYRYRGSRLEVLKKMIRFAAANPYTREEIFEATKRYVERFSIRGYAYMQQAHYFIDKKDTGSSLASECENLKETKSLQTTTNYGRAVI